MNRWLSCEAEGVRRGLVVVTGCAEDAVPVPIGEDWDPMPHIPLPDLPGITALLAYKPSTGAVLAELMQRLLRDEGPVPPAWRELIGGRVSARNDCEYCARSHTAVACALDPGLRDVAHDGMDPVGVDPQLAALLRLADAVADGGVRVDLAHVAAARDAGASDEAIHDTVLIAAAFCMINRYVDGLDTVTPGDEGHYRRSAARLAEHGYRRPGPSGAA